MDPTPSSVRIMAGDASAHETGIDLYWLPLGAGGHSVRWNGRIFEWVAAGLERAKLFSWDTVPVPVNPPRKLVPAELRRDPNAPPSHWKSNQWTLTVGKDGLRPR